MRTIAILLVLGVASPSVAQNRPRIAVMPLKAKRIQRDIVSIMDALLVSQVSRLGQFDVISAADIQAMLEAEGMKDALGCNEVTCAAEIGGALNARSTLAGTVGKLGSTIVINLTLFDNEKMTALRRANVEVKDDEDLFAGAVRAVVGQLFGAQSSALSPISGYTAPAAEILQEPGTLKVTSKPSGAYVVIDGKLAGTTPVDVDLLPGRHHVAVEKADHTASSKTVTLTRGQSLETRVSLASMEVARRARRSNELTVILTLGAGGLLASGWLILGLATEYSFAGGPVLSVVMAVSSLGLLVAGGVTYYNLPPALPGPRYLHRIDQLERLSATDDRHRQRGLSLAFEF